MTRQEQIADFLSNSFEFCTIKEAETFIMETWNFSEKNTGLNSANRESLWDSE